MRGPNPDHICGLCDEFDVDQVAPEFVELGMALCRVRAEQAAPAVLAVHVAWDCGACVSFRLDRPNLRSKRQFVEVQRRAQQNEDARARARDSSTETQQ